MIVAVVLRDFGACDAQKQNSFSWTVATRNCLGTETKKRNQRHKKLD